jgi:DNA-binding NarL/FixJ family response regulator
MNTKLLLLDENLLFRKGLSALLSQQNDLVVVDDCEAGGEAVQSASVLEPDVVIMDVRLGGRSGLDIAEQLKRRQTQIRILILTSARGEEYVRSALRIGIDGYILKDASLEELLIAIRSVVKGKKYLSPDVSGHLVESFLHPEGNGKLSRLDALTNRERGVLQLIAEGRTNRAAAEFLCVSPKTVEKHRASLMQKLGLRNATEMTLVAMEMGLIERPVSFARLMGGGGDSLVGSDNRSSDGAA